MFHGEDKSPWVIDLGTLQRGFTPPLMGLSGPEQPTRVGKCRSPILIRPEARVAGGGAGAGLAQSSFLRFHLRKFLGQGLSSLEPGGLLAQACLSHCLAPSSH